MSPPNWAGPAIGTEPLPAFRHTSQIGDPRGESSPSEVCQNPSNWRVPSLKKGPQWQGHTDPGAVRRRKDCQSGGVPMSFDEDSSAAGAPAQPFTVLYDETLQLLADTQAYFRVPVSLTTAICPSMVSSRLSANRFA